MSTISDPHSNCQFVRCRNANSTCIKYEISPKDSCTLITSLKFTQCLEDLVFEMNYRADSYHELSQLLQVTLDLSGTFKTSDLATTEKVIKALHSKSEVFPRFPVAEMSQLESLIHSKLSAREYLFIRMASNTLRKPNYYEEEALAVQMAVALSLKTEN